MSKMIQIRNVPDRVHSKIKSRAALAGMPLSDFLLREIELIVEKPTLAEMVERLKALPKIELDIVGAIREVRDR